MATNRVRASSMADFKHLRTTFRVVYFAERFARVFRRIRIFQMQTNAFTVYADTRKISNNVFLLSCPWPFSPVRFVPFGRETTEQSALCAFGPINER